MTIAITTPTGHVGSRVLQLVLQAGVKPRVLLRHPGKLDREILSRVDVREGDQRDADFVSRATEDVSALFWLDPPPAPDDPDPVATSERLGRNVAHAVRENGIARTVFMSSGGAEKRHGVGLIDGLARTEEALESAGRNVLHLRCGYLFTNLLMSIDELRHGTPTTSMDPDRPMPWVDPRDVGDVAAARLLSDAWTGRHSVGVHGPADLSYRDVAAIVTAVLGREIQLVTVSDAKVKAQLLETGMPERAAAAFTQMTAGIRDGYRPENPRSALTTTPTTLGAWAYATLKPALIEAARDDDE